MYRRNPIRASLIGLFIGQVGKFLFTRFEEIISGRLDDTHKNIEIFGGGSIPLSWEDCEKMGPSFHQRLSLIWEEPFRGAPYRSPLPVFPKLCAAAVASVEWKSKPGHTR